MLHQPGCQFWDAPQAQFPPRHGHAGHPEPFPEFVLCQPESGAEGFEVFTGHKLYVTVGNVLSQALPALQGIVQSDTPGIAGGLMSRAASKAVTRVCYL